MMAASAYLDAPDRRELPPLGSRLIEAACEFFGIEDRTLLFSKRRRGEISLARWALAYVLAEHAGWSLKRIGRLLNKEHPSVIYAVRRAHELLRRDPVFYAACERLEQEITR